MYQNFIGIDIAKKNFVVALQGQKKTPEFSNDEAGFNEFYGQYALFLEKGLVVLETTGGHEMALIRFLQSRDCAVHRANAAHVKYYIRSLGRLGKSDAIDAQYLASFGADRHEKLGLFKAKKNPQLQQLVQRRESLKQMIGQEKNRLQSPEQRYAKASIEKIIKLLSEELSNLTIEISVLCSKDPELQGKQKVLKTVPGIGDTVAISLLALLPELGTLNRKQIASLSGVAPHPNESGEKSGYRFTRGGRSEIKPILFMAAMAASRSHSRLGSFYNNLLLSGKKKMVALTALMRKIVVIANARLKEYLQGIEVSVDNVN